MKQSDIITIILITMIGTIAAAFAVNAILSNPDEASETWTTVEVVTADLVDPDAEMFNPDAINPTVEVYVGNCEDRDHDGQLSSEELIACGWMSSNKHVIKNNDGTTTVVDGDDEDDGPLTLEEILKRREEREKEQQRNENGQTIEELDENNTTIVPNVSPETETDNNTETGGDEVVVPNVEP